MNYEATFTACGFVAEIIVAAVIWYEWEGGRLDQFLSDADLCAKDRNRIYKAYCGLPKSDLIAQNELFKKLLNTDEKLLDSCNKHIRLLSRIGSRLPRIPWLRRTPLDWHIPVLLWAILSPYIEDRRKESGPSYAENLLRYTLASTKRLLRQKRQTWELRDPDRMRNQNATITREQLEHFKKQLKSALKSRS